MAFLKVIGKKAKKYESTLITALLIEYEIVSDVSEPQERIENFNLGSDNRHNYDSYFNMTF